MDKTARKRKRVQLTIEDKLKVCEMVKKNVTKSVIMSQFNIGKSTLNDILRSEEKFKKFKAEKEELGLTGAVKTAKKVKGGYFDKLDSALYIWFRQEREKGCPVTGPILLKKASEFHRLIYGEHSKPFLASSGFQWRFCRRFGLRSFKACDDDIQNWMSCDGPGYKHMDKQGIVALISGDNEKEADEKVEDENDVPQSSKCPFSHGEAMQKMDDYLAYYRCQPEATPQSVSQLVQFRDFSAKKRESKPPFFPFSARVPI